MIIIQPFCRQIIFFFNPSRVGEFFTENSQLVNEQENALHWAIKDEDQNVALPAKRSRKSFQKKNFGMGRSY